MSTMKTAQEWLTEPTHRKTEQQVVEWVKQIQLDAFKAGMTEAAEIAETAKVHVPADTKNYRAWASIDGALIKQAILDARDRKDLSL